MIINVKNKNEVAKNCYDTKPEGYRLDETESPKPLYVKCIEALCCEEKSITGDTKCLNGKCVSEFYPVYYKNSSNCIIEPYSKHYLDDNKVWQKCYNTCSECSTNGNSVDNNCTEYKCIENAYLSLRR